MSSTLMVPHEKAHDALMKPMVNVCHGSHGARLKLLWHHEISFFTIGLCDDFLLSCLCLLVLAYFMVPHDTP